MGTRRNERTFNGKKYRMMAYYSGNKPSGVMRDLRKSGKYYAPMTKET